MLTEETSAEAASFRLSPQQEQLWRRHPDGPPLAVRCTVDVGAADPAAVRDALAHAVARHEILRTTFARRQGLRLPGQLIHEHLEPSWAAEETLDLVHGPVVHAALADRTEGGRTLALTAAAACADASSLALLAAELQAELAGKATEATDPLQYADYAEWRAESFAAEEATWAVDAGPRSPALPLASGVEASDALPTRVAVDVDAPVVARGAEACRVSAAVFAEACWHALLSRLSGEAGALVGAVSRRSLAGRAGLRDRAVRAGASTSHSD